MELCKNMWEKEDSNPPRSFEFPSKTGTLNTIQTVLPCLDVGITCLHHGLYFAYLLFQDEHPSGPHQIRTGEAVTPTTLKTPAEGERIELS